MVSCIQVISKCLNKIEPKPLGPVVPEGIGGTAHNPQCFSSRLSRGGGWIAEKPTFILLLPLRGILVLESIQHVRGISIAVGVGNWLSPAIVKEMLRGH